MATARKAQDPAKFRRYRERMKARGLKEVRLWVADPAAPGFLDDLKWQAALLRAAPEERETLGFIEAAGAWSDEA